MTPSKPVGETTVDGAYLLTRFDFRRRRRIAGFTDLIYDVSATAHIHGLGYSFVEIVERTIGMRFRLWVLATPVDGSLIDMVLVSQLRELRKPRRPISGLGFLPVKLRTRLMNRILMSSQVMRRSPGRDDMAKQAVPSAAEPLPLRRRDRQVPALLQAVLPVRPRRRPAGRRLKRKPHGRSAASRRSRGSNASLRSATAPTGRRTSSRIRASQ